MLVFLYFPSRDWLKNCFIDKIVLIVTLGSNMNAIVGKKNFHVIEALSSTVENQLYKNFRQESGGLYFKSRALKIAG